MHAQFSALQHTVHQVHTDLFASLFLAACAADPLLMQAAAGESGAGSGSGRGFAGGSCGEEADCPQE